MDNHSGQTDLVGCGTEGHDYTCLCDVAVTEPIEIQTDALRFMWNLGRAATQIGWAIGDDPLELLEALALAHDKWAEAQAELRQQAFEDAELTSRIHTAELDEARRICMATVNLQAMKAERVKTSKAYVACDGSTNAALTLLGWDWETFTIRTHLYANAFRTWTPQDCDRYIARRLSGATRSTLRTEFLMNDENISSIDKCVGMGQLISMRGVEDPHAVSSHNTQIRHSDELREFCVQGRRNGMAVADLIRICHERFGQAPSRPTIYKWEKADVDSRNPLAIRRSDQDAA